MKRCANPAAVAMLAALSMVARPSEAATLRVAPILIDVTTGATSTVVLENLDAESATIQLRMFRWRQKNGKNILTPTRDVVVSPPFIRLKAGRKNKLRIVRLSRRPIRGEESYRLIIDQLPRRKNGKATTVGFKLRYSVPVFFGTGARSNGQVKWNVREHNGSTVVTATNTGQKRVRLVALKVKGAGKRTVSFGRGLVGYVLGRSTAIWKKMGQVSHKGRHGQVLITANTEHGKIRRKVRLQSSR